MDQQQPSSIAPGTLDKPGDPLCVRFINTLDWRNDPALRAETLSAYPDLVRWAQSVGLLDAGEARDLLSFSASHPNKARQALEEALAFRESLYRVFSAVAARRPSPPADLAALNRAWAESAARAALIAQGENLYSWAWKKSSDALTRVLGPIAWSAAELLTSGPLDRLRECERGGCGWLFLDATRNRSRRWCAMRVCGNRSKVERYYRRHRKEQ